MLRTRPPLALLGRLREALRPGRGRTTTAVALGAAGSLVAGIVVAGMGAAGANPDLSQIGAWLVNDDKSSVSHVNGLTGQVDGRIQLPRGNQTQLQVAEDGTTILVLDGTTGLVSRIDPAQLTVPATTERKDTDAVVTGNGSSWILDYKKGVVQTLDLRDPTQIVKGPEISLGAAPLGPAGVDASGTLWVPISVKGHVVPVKGQSVGAPIKIAEPGSPLILTMVSGKPVVTDAFGGTVSVISTSGVERTITLPTEFRQGRPDKLLAPLLNEGPLVPILASDTGKLALIDIDSGSVKAVPLEMGAHTYEPPQVLGAKVYIADNTERKVLVYNTVQGKFEAHIAFEMPKPEPDGKPAPRMQAYVRTGLLFVNDPATKDGAVINVQGQVNRVVKYVDGQQPGSGPPTGTATPTPAKSVPEGGVTEEPPSSAPATTADSRGTPPNGKESQGSTAPPQPPVIVPSPPVNGQGPGGNGNGNGGNQGRDKSETPRATPSERETEKPAPQPTETRGPKPPKSSPPVFTPPVELPTTLPTRPSSPPPPQPTPPQPTPPQPTPPSTSTAPTPPAPTTPAPATSTTKPPTTSSKPPTSTKPPVMKPPGNPTATSGVGKITITFTPAPDAEPLRYRLGGVGAGMGVSPASVSANGPFGFTVTGGSCTKEYSFYVIAEYPGGFQNSKASIAVRPCVPPGKPTSLTAEPVAGGKVKVAWKRPTNTASEQIDYVASWTLVKATTTTSKPPAKPASLTEAATEAVVPALLAEPPAVNFPVVADGTEAAALAAPSSGSIGTSNTSVTFSVGGVAGEYTFKVASSSPAGKSSSNTATLNVDLTWGGNVSATLVMPPEEPGTAPYPPTPHPTTPTSDKDVVRAAAVPPRRDDAGRRH